MDDGARTPRHRSAFLPPRTLGTISKFFNRAALATTPPNTNCTVMPAPLFGRFVPPKPANPAPVSASPPPTATPKPAQPKKEKSKRRHGEETEATVGSATENPPSSDKKPKKRKRDTVADTADEEADAGSKKHKSILSKFEKVTKKAQEHALKRQEDGEELDDASNKAQPVLRGTSLSQRDKSEH
jgi:hypothetical protein